MVQKEQGVGGAGSEDVRREGTGGQVGAHGVPWDYPMKETNPYRLMAVSEFLPYIRAAYGRFEPVLEARKIRLAKEAAEDKKA
jgi:hypothetical protein